MCAFCFSLACVKRKTKKKKKEKNGNALDICQYRRTLASAQTIYPPPLCVYFFLHCSILASYCNTGCQKNVLHKDSTSALITSSPRKEQRQSQCHHRIACPQQRCSFTFGDDHHAQLNDKILHSRRTHVTYSCSGYCR